MTAPRMAAQRPHLEVRMGPPAVPRGGLDEAKQFHAVDLLVFESGADGRLLRALDQLTDQPLGGIRPGYINQEVIKLAFSGLGLANNYLPIDSDAVILRPFGAKDLMFDDQTPFSILVEDNDLKVDPAYYEQNCIGRAQSLAKIAEILDFQDLRMLTCHGHQILSTRVIESLNEDFLAPKGWTYLDMLAESPYEFSWYNFWLQKSRPIRIEIREPLFKVVHSASQTLNSH